MKTQLQDMDVKFISNSNNQNPGGRRRKVLQYLQ